MQTVTSVQQPCSNPSESPEMPGNTPTHKYADLQQFCKPWNGPAKHRAALAWRRSGVQVPSGPLTGRQRYERVLDGAFVLQHWTYYHPDFPDAMALLSDDRYHYFDVRGITRVFELEVDNAGWSMIRLDEDFSQRSTARFRGPDVMESTGEISHDNGVTWQPDFTMTYQRVE